MRIAGKSFGGVGPLRPERPFPDGVAALVGEIERGRLPAGAAVLRPQRRLRRRSYIAVVAALGALGALGWNIFAASQEGARTLGSRAPATLLALVSVVVEVGIVALVMGGIAAYVLWFDLRRRNPKKILVVTPDHLLSLGDPLGVQWFGAWEVESLTTRGGDEEQGGLRVPSLEVVFRNGNVEEVFLDPALEGREVRAWLAEVSRTFRYGRSTTPSPPAG